MVLVRGGRLMDLAVRTTASPTAIWVIVIVMSLCTGILVSAAGIADSRQARASRRKAGMFSLESTTGADGTAAAVDAGTGHPGSGEEATGRPAWPEPDPAGEAPTRPDLPPVTGRHAMPAQRSGDADQPERSYRGTSAAGGDHPGQN